MRYHASSFAFVGTLQRARAHLESHLSGSCQLVASRRPPLSTSQGRVERSLPRRNRIKSGMAMHPCPRESEREWKEEQGIRFSSSTDGMKFRIEDPSCVDRSPSPLLFGNLFAIRVYRIPSLHLRSNVFSGIFPPTGSLFSLFRASPIVTSYQKLKSRRNIFQSKNPPEN